MSSAASTSPASWPTRSGTGRSRASAPSTTSSASSRPRSCPRMSIYPKEQALIDICKKQKADGVQTWVYVQMSGKRNIQPRLKALLEKRGAQGRRPPVGRRGADRAGGVDRPARPRVRRDDLPPAARQHGPRPVLEGPGRPQLRDHRLLRDGVQPLHHAAGGPPGVAHRPAPRLPGLLPLLQGDDAA